MCSTVPKNPNGTPYIPRIAEYDIICYKSTSNVSTANFLWFETPIQDFIYWRGKKTKTVKLFIKQVITGLFIINEGYHSFGNLDLAKRTLDKVGKFKIPKGATYFHNFNENEYVSSNLIYLGRVSR